MDRNILDAASGGALVDKTPVDAKALIENMSLNSQQFTTRNNSMVQTKGVNDIQVSSSNKALETRIEELTSLVKQMAMSKPQTTKLCGICTSTEHPTDTCPILQDESVTQLPQAYAANFFNQNNNQKGYNIPDLSTNKYHPNWRNHPNLRYGNQQPTQQQLVTPLPQTTPQVSTSAPSGPSLEDLVKQMVVNNLQFQQRTDSSIQTLQTQIGQLATSMNAMQQAQGANQLPSQTVVNRKGPNANVSAISLRSGKVPKYAKFLKDLCTSKRRLKGNERVNLGGNISALIQLKHSPEKATISSLNQHTCLIIQLANRSNARPIGVVEDVLVQGNISPTSEVVHEVIYAIEALDIPVVPNTPSIEQPPSLELKQLPENLKYAYLDSNEKLPDGCKTVRQPQMRLNPLILDVVKKEVTKLLQAGYFQIHIAPEDQEKTTFTCPFGTFAYRRMPFGLCNAPGTFQRCMISIFADFIENCMEVFMDDFTVYGSPFDACLNSLNLVLERCIEIDLVLNYEKCHFMVEHGIVLGHIISKKGISVDPVKVDVISTLPYPSFIREIRSFLGHAGFYRRFIKDFSKIALPLSNLLKNDVTFNFDDNCKKAFDFLKEALTSAPII
ncbi:uncharacterized protein LOC127081499 [Lathyrus oleraceus]|uniref:uncharacterized protein LOC127081499 n=1 Tax=Pisum sativum TaxID=3888 RepID=UPI0021D013C2|nr:uncharacterized protein LOC127081499 [Pisum sativum]